MVDPMQSGGSSSAHALTHSDIALPYMPGLCQALSSNGCELVISEDVLTMITSHLSPAIFFVEGADLLCKNNKKVTKAGLHVFTM